MGKLTARWTFGTHVSCLLIHMFCEALLHAEPLPLLVTNAIFALNERKAPSFVKRFPEEAASSRNSSFPSDSLGKKTPTKGPRCARWNKKKYNFSLIRSFLCVGERSGEEYEPLLLACTFSRRRRRAVYEIGAAAQPAPVARRSRLRAGRFRLGLHCRSARAHR